MFLSCPSAPGVHCKISAFKLYKEIKKLERVQARVAKCVLEFRNKSHKDRSRNLNFA